MRDQEKASTATYLPLEDYSEHTNARRHRSSVLAKAGLTCLVIGGGFALLLLLSASSVKLPTIRNALSLKTTEIDIGDGLLQLQDASLVYLWVNGSDPGFQAVHGEYDPSSRSHTERFRDTGDLKYSLRSITENMPWHKGTIYLVSLPGHVPNWLDADHPRFRHITHAEIIPEEVLPVFNSNVIEQYLHLIPGISDIFISMNDDFIINRLTKPSDFYTPDEGIRVYVENGDARDMKSEAQWPMMLKNSMKMLEEEYENVGHKDILIPAHAPYVYFTAAMKGMHNRFSKQLRQAAQNKIRQATDAVVHIMHAGYVFYEGSHCCRQRMVQNHAPNVTFSALWTEDVAANYATLRLLDEKQPLFLNLQDQMNVDNLAEEALEQFQHEMSIRFPRKSPFEL